MREAVGLLQGLLTAVDSGELDASTPSARALVRRLEGAVIALKLALDDEPPPS